MTVTTVNWTPLFLLKSTCWSVSPNDLRGKRTRNPAESGSGSRMSMLNPIPRAWIKKTWIQHSQHSYRFSSRIKLSNSPWVSHDEERHYKWIELKSNYSHLVPSKSHCVPYNCSSSHEHFMEFPLKSHDIPKKPRKISMISRKCQGFQWEFHEFNGICPRNPSPRGHSVASPARWPRPSPRRPRERRGEPLSCGGGVGSSCPKTVHVFIYIYIYIYSFIYLSIYLSF